MPWPLSELRISLSTGAGGSGYEGAMTDNPLPPECTIDPEEHPVVVIQRLVNEIDQLNHVVYDLNCQSLRYRTERDALRSKVTKLLTDDPESLQAANVRLTGIIGLGDEQRAKLIEFNNTLRGRVKELESERYDLITVAMGAEYAFEYPDNNPVMAALGEYEEKWGELPAGPKPDEVKDILLAAIEKVRRAQGERP